MNYWTVDLDSNSFALWALASLLGILLASDALLYFAGQIGG
jgi:hypothetical protein